MGLLKGIPVVLIDREKVSDDPFGHPVFEKQEILVENVLVSPTDQEDVVNQLHLTGKRAVYTLAIPKDDVNDWEDKEVRFFDKRWKVFTPVVQGIDALIPLEWNKKVMVERHE